MVYSTTSFGYQQLPQPQKSSTPFYNSNQSNQSNFNQFQPHLLTSTSYVGSPDQPFNNTSTQDPSSSYYANPTSNGYYQTTQPQQQGYHHPEAYSQPSVPLDSYSSHLPPSIDPSTTSASTSYYPSSQSYSQQTSTNEPSLPPTEFPYLHPVSQAPLNTTVDPNPPNREVSNWELSKILHHTTGGGSGGSFGGSQTGGTGEMVIDGGYQHHTAQHHLHPPVNPNTNSYLSTHHHHPQPSDYARPPSAQSHSHSHLSPQSSNEGSSLLMTDTESYHPPTSHTINPSLINPYSNNAQPTPAPLVMPIPPGELLGEDGEPYPVRMPNPPRPHLGSAHIENMNDGSLWTLKDAPNNNEGKPYYPYSVLIRFAILGSQDKALYLQEIYRAIEERYYRKHDKGWLNSVRHTLSINKCFVQVKKGKEIIQPGKGHRWKVDLEAPPVSSRAESRKESANRKKAKLAAKAAKEGTVGDEEGEGDEDTGAAGKKKKVSLPDHLKKNKSTATASGERRGSVTAAATAAPVKKTTLPDRLRRGSIIAPNAPSGGVKRRGSVTISPLVPEEVDGRRRSSRVAGMPVADS